jgi:hypothetical protein
MNIERVKNMFDSLTRVDEIMKENGFVKEKIFHSSESFYSHETLKIRAQLLTENLNFYHLYGTKIIFSYKFNDFLSDSLRLNEKKFIEIVKSVKEKFLLESVSEDFE